MSPHEGGDSRTEIRGPRGEKWRCEVCQEWTPVLIRCFQWRCCSKGRCPACHTGAGHPCYEPGEDERPITAAHVSRAIAEEAKD
jgi:hypothetical protein